MALAFSCDDLFTFPVDGADLVVILCHHALEKPVRICHHLVMGFCHDRGIDLANYLFVDPTVFPGSPDLGKNPSLRL